MAYFELRPTCASPDYPIYGAEWAGTSDPSWTRTDAAATFSDPNPYYAGMSGTPSSPFDNISPWKDMVISEDSEAGILVSIPKFYYKWTRTGDKMKLQISMHQYDGFFVSPFHMDRGDGKGERDIAYGGRFHCASDYKSKAGVKPKASATRATFRSGIHNLGSTIWQGDLALFWTLRMLYLVEFAHWNSQEKIGYGCGNGSSAGNMGYTNSMPYHTGTTQSSRTTYGLGTQYRYFEGLWDNVYDFVDGVYGSGTNLYCIKNPANFSDSSGGVNVLSRNTIDAEISAWTQSSVTGYEYVVYPSAGVSNSNYDTYVCDQGYVKTTGTTTVATGNHWDRRQLAGLFHIYSGIGVSETYAHYGSRLMKLP